MLPCWKSHPFHPCLPPAPLMGYIWSVWQMQCFYNIENVIENGVEGKNWHIHLCYLSFCMYPIYFRKIAQESSIALCLGIRYSLFDFHLHILSIPLNTHVFHRVPVSTSTNIDTGKECTISISCVTPNSFLLQIFAPTTAVGTDYKKVG